MFKRTIFALFCATAFGTAPDAAAPLFHGKSGEGLKEAVRASVRPPVLAPLSALSGAYADPFSGSRIEISQGVLPDGWVWSTAVPPEWWSPDACAYADTLSRNLVNRLPMKAEDAAAKGTLAPGAVEKVEYQGAAWCVGTATVAGIDVRHFAPPEQWRGPLARVMFYMATLYPCKIWAADGLMMMEGTPFPGLTPYAIPLLLQWHRDFPVSDSERHVNDAVTRLQGAANPFVEYPDLPEYIWGDKLGQPFIASQDVPVPLKASYASDETLWLASPSVPDGAVWSIDGTPAAATHVAASSIGSGTHRLSYTVPDTSEWGLIMIEVLP